MDVFCSHAYLSMQGTLKESVYTHTNHFAHVMSNEYISTMLVLNLQDFTNKHNCSTIIRYA